MPIFNLLFSTERPREIHLPASPVPPYIHALSPLSSSARSVKTNPQSQTLTYTSTATPVYNSSIQTHTQETLPYKPNHPQYVSQPQHRQQYESEPRTRHHRRISRGNIARSPVLRSSRRGHRLRNRLRDWRYRRPRDRTGRLRRRDHNRTAPHTTRDRNRLRGYR